MRVVKHWHRLPREVVDAPSPRNIQGQGCSPTTHVGVVQSREKKAPRRPCCKLSILQVYKKYGESLFTKVCRDRRRGNGFKLKGGGETLEQVATRIFICPVPGSVQSQIGQVFEQPDLVTDVSAHTEGLDQIISEVPTNPNHY
ncbi:hypothetical protein QYF61_008568, partial [Mycteria americana]